MAAIGMFKILRKDTGACLNVIEAGDRERDGDEPHVKREKRRLTAESKKQRWLSNYDPNLSLIILEVR